MTLSQQAAPRLTTRLPLPELDAKERGIDISTWNALLMQFRNVNNPSSILAAFDWAKSRGLNAVKGHVQIVPQRVNKQDANGQWINETIDQVWLSQKGLLFTAHQSGCAGIDNVVYGEQITETMHGRTQIKGKWTNISEEVTYPAWAQITVHKMVDGQKCAFTTSILYTEFVPRTAAAKPYGDSPGLAGIPTKIWIEKAHYMLRKCVLAAALREAFPDIDYTADEAVGRDIDASGEVVGFPEGEPIAQGENHSQQSSSVSYDDNRGPQTSNREVSPGNTSLSFDQIDKDALFSLKNQLSTANGTGAFEPVISYIKDNFDPRYVDLGVSLVVASQTIVNCDIYQSLGPWMGKAVGQLPGSFDPAIRHVKSKLDEGHFTVEVAQAIETVLSFYKTCTVFDQRAA